jgi:hypothetical protein
MSPITGIRPIGASGYNRKKKNIMARGQPGAGMLTVGQAGPDRQGRAGPPKAHIIVDERGGTIAHPDSSANLPVPATRLTGVTFDHHRSVFEAPDCAYCKRPKAFRHLRRSGHRQEDHIDW